MQNAGLEQLTERLLPWYAAHARKLPWRENQDPYHVWVSEIMLQQTRVEAVKPYFLRFMQTLPTIKDLSDCDDELLMKLWEGLGYYSRARNLKKAANQIIQDFHGKFPEEYSDILSLSGVGPYTAGAIASICFDKPVPAVDGNVLRVYSRLTCDGRCVDEQAVRADITGILGGIYTTCLPVGEGSCGKLTQALMELGATVCIPNGAPRCDVCPLKENCLALAQNQVMELPVRMKKKERRKEHYTVFLLECSQKFAIRKRPDSGMLAGLWEFPHTDGTLETQEALHTLSAWGVQAEEVCSERKCRHIFTHIEWHMTCIHVQVKNMPQCFHWVTMEQLLNEAALPTAFRICMPK
ncbi:MAG: A/G-specific adenine glycosylase [Oscillospiraceae bacterium]|nr:A/G-specific adenine glycosylase [Oscillospiraceae bacterium]